MNDSRRLGIRLMALIDLLERKKLFTRKALLAMEKELEAQAAVVRRRRERERFGHDENELEV